MISNHTFNIQFRRSETTMKALMNVCWTFILLNLFYQAISKSQDHPYFRTVQNNALRIWKVISHLCQNFLTNIKKATPIKNPISKEGTPDDFMNTESYIESIFVILSVLSFIYVISYYIWNYWKKQRNVTTTSTAKVLSNQTFKKKDSDKLKEAHKILQTLTQQLKPAPPSRIPRLHALHTSKNRLPSRSLLSNVSKRQEIHRSLSNEELTHNLQAALQLLEEEIGNKNTTADIKTYEELDTSERTLHCNDDALSFHENEWDQGDIPSEMKQRNIEEWIKNFEKYETPLFVAKESENRKVLSHLEKQNGIEAYNECSKLPMPPSSHNGNFWSYSKNSPRDDRKQKLSSSNNLFTNNSPEPNLKRNRKNEHLKKSLREALEFLEKETVNDESETGETLKCQEVDVSEMSKSISEWNVNGNDRTLYKSENQPSKKNAKPFNSEMNQAFQDTQIKHQGSDGFVCVTGENSRQRSSSSLYNAIGNEEVESCKEYLKEEEALPLFHPQVASKKITERESKDKSLRIRCPKIKQLECTTPELNLNIQPTSTGNRIMNGEEFSKQTTKPAKSKDVFNVSANKNALNIKILFNRDIQLSKPM